MRARREKMRFDSGIRLSHQERRVDSYLTSLRDELIARYKQTKHFPPSLPFYKYRDEIRETELYRFLKGMPKGGILHIHIFSTAPIEWILDHAIMEPGCFVCWPRDRDAAHIKGQLGFFAPGEVPEGYLPVKDVIEQTPDFPALLRSLLTVDVGDAILTNLQIWSEFNKIFQRLERLISYQPVFTKYYKAAFQRLLEDNIDYVELRAGFVELYDLEGNRWDFRGIADLYRQIRNDIREEHPTFDLKLIYSGLRCQSRQEVWNAVEQAVALRKEWEESNFILGFDLVGEEDAGYTTRYFLPNWIKLKDYLKQKGTTFPFYFHDGESDWPNDENLYDAYLLGSRRIGHGFNLFRFPNLEQCMKRDGVALEVCPISNQALGYLKDLRIHPASGYLNRGVPCVICSDDPGIFGNDGLAYDYWQTVVAWNLDLSALKQLAMNSILYSGMTEKEKQIAMNNWEKAWSNWIDDLDDR
jgi:adenosine deaminase CECR1